MCAIERASDQRLEEIHSAEKPEDWLFNGQPLENRKGEILTPDIHKKGVQWAVSQPKSRHKQTRKRTHAQTYLCYSFARRSTDIVTLKGLLGHESIETTMIYLHLPKVAE
ncbi:MAG: tyrosine-type recombinase/integrase [Cytophagaceae bacterium]|nr:tyrosine-type recombinase/integrase [Cytophagaceae bacterium]